MRRFLVALVVLVLSLTTVPVPTSTAFNLNSAEFAAKCSAGTYTVGADLSVRGGHGTLTGNCVIEIASDVTLRFSNASIDGAFTLTVADSLQGSRIVVHRSTLDVGGHLQLAAGCCAGGGEPSHLEDHGTAIVTGSVLRGRSVEVSGSTAADDGRVVIKKSFLEATDSGFGVRIRSSVPAVGGSIVVKHTSFVSAGDVLIDTFTSGSTVVRSSTFSASAGTEIKTGPGGTCLSVGNGPPIPCT